MITRIENFLSKYEALVLILLLAAFLVVNSQALSWGLPASWNPDELARVVIRTLNDGEPFNQTNFDYPSLPKYVMLLIGRITDSLGYPRTVYFLAARFFSVFLGAMIVWLAYALVRQLGGKRWSALLAALLVATNNQLSLNSHFAHNDMYVTFFAGMTLLFSIKYLKSENKGWLYVAFFTAGMTASSKYNGGAIMLVVVLAYLMLKGKQIFRDKMTTFETLFTGIGLTVLGYALGTPTALTHLSFYFRHLIPTLWYQANYERYPNSVIGLIKQWQYLYVVLGPIFFILIMLTLIVVIVATIQYLRKRNVSDYQHGRLFLLLLAGLFLLDLPILISYNVQNRYFLPLLPGLAVVVAIGVELLVEKVEQNNKARLYQSIIGGLCILGVLWGALRVASVIVLMENDARNPAGEYLKSLPAGVSVERTFYSPIFYDKERFSSYVEYPLIFLKFADQQITDPYGREYNVGEEGIEKRKPDYLIVSSFMYTRFVNHYICERHQADCNFFRDLLAGDTNYQKIAEFHYDLPWYLPFPKIDANFVNPDILVFKRDK